MSEREDELVDPRALYDEVEDEQSGDGDDAVERTGEDAVRAPDWSVQVLKSERSVFELHHQWRAGRLVLNADFQRAYIWERRQQIRLIESVLAKIPLPAIYVLEESEDRTLVLDGLQRLTTLFRFMDGEFKLQSLALLPTFEGKRFGDLDARMQRRIEDTALTVCSIQGGSDPDLKFYLFERLNQGGVSLNAQEIRNGIFRGAGLDLVQRLAAPDGPFRRVAGLGRIQQPMMAEELVLRGLAFLMRDSAAYPGDMAPFLNETLRELNGMSSEQRDAWERRYRAILDAVQAAFGDEAFRRFEPQTQSTNRHLNAAVMDIQLHGFHHWKLAAGAKGDSSKLVRLAGEHGAAIREASLALYDDPNFAAALTYSTSITSRVRLRLRAWQEVLDHVA